MIMKRTQQGMTMIETMAALAIATMLMLGLSEMINSSLDEVKGQQTALHQAQVANAARKYMAANYAALVAATAGGTRVERKSPRLNSSPDNPDRFSGAHAFRRCGG